MKSIAWAILVVGFAVIASWYEISGHKLSDGGEKTLGAITVLSLIGFLLSLIP